MTRPKLFSRTRGAGPAIVLVHGSAATADGWIRSQRLLSDRYRVTAVDRRGTARSCLPKGVSSWSVEAHVEDLVAVLEHEVEGPAVVCGSSFGAVCVMELSRLRPDLLRGVVLCEPPLPPVEKGDSVVEAFAEEFERRREDAGGAAAVHFFLEKVLGADDAARLPAAWREVAEAQETQIRLDVEALRVFRPKFGVLTQVRVPALMVGGARSVSFYGMTLERLRASYPVSARLTMPEVGHMMHLDDPEAFCRVISAFEARFIDPPDDSA